MCVCGVSLSLVIKKERKKEEDEAYEGLGDDSMRHC